MNEDGKWHQENGQPVAAVSWKVTLEQADCMARPAAEPISQDNKGSQAGLWGPRERKPLLLPVQKIKVQPQGSSVTRFNPSRCYSMLKLELK
jgi:hypothetical protein